MRLDELRRPSYRDQSPRYTLLLVVAAIALTFLQLGCYVRWVGYHPEPEVTPAIGGEFHFDVWHSKEPNPKYFGKPISETEDTSHLSLLLCVAFHPFHEDSSI
ncbi:MAG TPA: hypothetical protein VMS71_01150, partial [Candidatus Acidoferrum sp.]|nr:hypothetical protein [Candidatus Acidoferrum sp.]